MSLRPVISDRSIIEAFLMQYCLLRGKLNFYLPDNRLLGLRDIPLWPAVMAERDSVHLERPFTLICECVN